MDESLKKELLDNIILSAKSQDKIVTPEEKTHFELNDKRVDVNKSIHFDFHLSKSENNNDYPKYSFKVSIDKIPNAFYFKNRKDENSQYVTTIKVSEVLSNYGNWRDADTYQFNSKTDDTQEKQKELFNFLMDKHLQEAKRKENEKINKYLKEAKKLHSKEVVRDEKLDKLLS